MLMRATKKNTPLIPENIKINYNKIKMYQLMCFMYDHFLIYDYDTAFKTNYTTMWHQFSFNWTQTKYIKLILIDIP